MDRLAKVLYHHPFQLAYYPPSTPTFSTFTRNHRHQRCILCQARNRPRPEVISIISPSWTINILVNNNKYFSHYIFTSAIQWDLFISRISLQNWNGYIRLISTFTLLSYYFFLALLNGFVYYKVFHVLSVTYR